MRAGANAFARGTASWLLTPCLRRPRSPPAPARGSFDRRPRPRPDVHPRGGQVIDAAKRLRRQRRSYAVVDDTDAWISGSRNACRNGNGRARFLTVFLLQNKLHRRCGDVGTELWVGERSNTPLPLSPHLLATIMSGISGGHKGSASDRLIGLKDPALEETCTLSSTKRSRGKAEEFAC